MAAARSFGAKDRVPQLRFRNDGGEVECVSAYLIFNRASGRLLDAFTQIGSAL